jgi:hypothetical protein
MDRRTFNKSIAAAYGLVALPQLTSVKENKQPTLKYLNIEYIYEQFNYELQMESFNFFSKPNITITLAYENDFELTFNADKVEHKWHDTEPLIDFNGEKIDTGNNRIYYTFLSIDFYLDGMKIDPLDINDKKTKYYEAVIHMSEDLSKRRCATFLSGVVLKERREA